MSNRVVQISASLLLGLVIGGFSRRIRKMARKRQEQSADVTQRLLEILSGIKVVKAFRAEQEEMLVLARQAGSIRRRASSFRNRKEVVAGDALRRVETMEREHMVRLNRKVAEAGR